MGHKQGVQTKNINISNKKYSEKNKCFARKPIFQSSAKIDNNFATPCITVIHVFSCPPHIITPLPELCLYMQRQIASAQKSCVSLERKGSWRG